MRNANELSGLFQNDPQMQLPLYPKIAEDLLLVWANSQTLIIVGGAKDVLIRGKSVRRLLPSLLPLLDGTRTVDDITAQISRYSGAAIRDSLSLLFVQGVLVDGCPTVDPKAKAKAMQMLNVQRLFYERYLDLQRIPDTAEEVIVRLQQARVVLVGNGHSARMLAYELMALGIGHLDLAPLDDAASWQALAGKSPLTEVSLYTPQAVDYMGGQDLILYVTDAPDPDMLAHLNDAADTHDIPLLAATIQANHIEIGHLYLPHQSPCYTCAQRQGALRWHLTGSQHHRVFTFNEGWIAPEERLAVGLVALRTARTLSGQLRTNAAQVVYEFDFARLTWQSRNLYLIAGCARCGSPLHIPGDLQLGGEHCENLPLLYHQNTRLHGYQNNPKDHQIHYSANVIQTMRQAKKHYDGFAAIPLPAPILTPAFGQPYALPQIRSVPSEVSDLQLVSTLFRTVAEVSTIELPNLVVQRRTTPSGGGMISQSLYFINLSLPGLPQGLYYISSNGTLELLRAGDLLEAIVGCLPPEVREVPSSVGAVIQTNAMGRLESKYGLRAYLYAMLDAGVMMHCLHYVAGLVGIALDQTLNFYDDRVSELLGLYSSNEIPSTVMWLRMNRGG